MTDETRRPYDVEVNLSGGCMLSPEQARTLADALNRSYADPATRHQLIVLPTEPEAEALLRRVKITPTGDHLTATCLSCRDTWPISDGTPATALLATTRAHWTEAHADTQP